MPDDWPGFEITFRYRSTVYEISIVKSLNAETPGPISLVDDGATHLLTIQFRRGPPCARARFPLLPALRARCVPRARCCS